EESLQIMRDPVNKRPNILTFFFQGHNGARSQAAKYAGPEGVDVLVGDTIKHASCAKAPRILHNIYTYPELNDVGYESFNPYHQIVKLCQYIGNKSKGIEAQAHISYVTRWNVGG